MAGKIRLAVIDYNVCKPRKCSYECINVCPINKSGRGIAIKAEKERKGKPVIFEDICIGCGLCVKACPFDAIYIVNLPSELEEEAIHRYDINGFKLYRLPIPKDGKAIGIIGKNGTGKTTAVRILAGEVKPNLGDPNRDPEWDEIIRRFRGSELQTYLQRLVDKKLRVAHKIQHVDLVPRYIKGPVGELLAKADERGIAKELAQELGLDSIWDRDIRRISGGELQKLLVAAVLSKEANVYIFDEPSSYLDVRERMRIASLIMREVKPGRYFIIIEHDLAVLDYVTEIVHILYGEPGAYGIVSSPYGTRVGVNNFLDGYLPAENIRLRKEPIRFKRLSEASLESTPHKKIRYLEWTDLVVQRGDFTLRAEAGDVWSGEVVGIIGPNGIGKTTFIMTLAGKLKPKDGMVLIEGEFSVSYKPQYVGPELFPEDWSVGDLLKQVNPEAALPGSWLYLELIRKLRLDRLWDREARKLSGGEMQKLAVAISLAREADIYLLDEPSAYLDVEERLAVARAIKRVTEGRGAVAFVVEHDLLVVDFISEKLIPILGRPGFEGHAHSPMSLHKGMNIFLKELGVTFRRDPVTGRPRANKPGSYLDRMQKAKGEYYYAGY